ncbi:peptidyl-glycine alpha-amidating monooxygenase A isoform X2 [Nematostella vectensis]|uniref:peptidyl-glycine alpha-amidating monooxygenase A isoform X2 n=1 Tax=Nematostella vectensis TaxID=45351 RepID=UPI002077539A|nr:peptidyl-glycine alpha-amidating monooxygenase A isoform X2 [Nematostella vectensis]
MALFSWVIILLGMCFVEARFFENYENTNGEYGFNRGFDELYQPGYQRSMSEDVPTIEMKMPNVRPLKHDSYFCTAVPVKSDEAFIVGYEPHAEMHTAHHMLLFGCSTPASKEGFWNCGDMGVGVCASGSPERIMYAWGRNAPKLNLPKGVAFKVGQASSVKYLVLQVHYGHVDKFVKNPKLHDSSGVTLQTTHMRQPYRAAIYLLANGYGVIPPAMKAAHLDMGCAYSNKATMHPFAFRVHAHSLGSVITGYRVRDGKWTLIGKGDPQRPQAFYPIKQEVDIKDGDTLAARCTYNTMKKDRITYIGATMKDEMCNFYMMFYYDPNEAARSEYSPEDSCGYAKSELLSSFPAGSDIPLPGSGGKMEMKRGVECASTDDCSGYKRSMTHLELQDHWPSDPTLSIGQVSGVAIDLDGNVTILHRAGRPWDGNTFYENTDVLRKELREPLKTNVLLWLDPQSGLVMREEGSKAGFVLPHGLSFDQHGNMWATDVGLHQVFKFDAGRFDGPPSMVLGTKYEPGSTLSEEKIQFCKPTDVAVDEEGNIFIADGYCNQRVVKLDKNGKPYSSSSYKTKFHASVPLPHHMTIPHSLSMDHKNKILYIADRENGRILASDPETGTITAEYKSEMFGGRVFAIHYNDGGFIHLVTGSPNAKGLTYDLKSKIVTDVWKPEGVFDTPHDVTGDHASGSVYVAEIGNNKILKFKARK